MVQCSGLITVNTSERVGTSEPSLHFQTFSSPKGEVADNMNDVESSVESYKETVRTLEWIC